MARASGDSSFGVDSDFYKSDPCPGSNFGTVPPCVVTGSAVGLPDFTCKFAPDGFNRSEAVCELGSLRQVIDFETEDDFVTPLVNGQAISSPPFFGNLVSINGFGPHRRCC